MFLLEDGREHLFQWDLNRRVIVEDPTVKEVHFCNRTDECSLVVEVEETAIFADGKETTLRTANIPNIILQQPWDIRVYAVCTDGYTKVEETFKVKARTKPSDYVYTETELKNYDDLVKRIDEIEKNGISDEVITEAVNDYLDEHPVQTVTKVSELENDADYANKAYVDESVQNVQVDLTGYATEKYVDDAVKNVSVDLSGYATEDYVDDAIAQAALGGEVDLSDYAKKSDIPDVSGFLTEVPSEYITETELNNKNYANKQYVDDAIANIDITEGGSGGSGDGEMLYAHNLSLTGRVGGSTSGDIVAGSAYVVTASAEPFTLETLSTYVQENGRVSVSMLVAHSAGSLTDSRLYCCLDYDTTQGGLYVSNVAHSATGYWAKDISIKHDNVIAIGRAAVSGSTGDVDLSDYYTKTEVEAYVDEAIANIELPEGAAGCEIAYITNSATVSDVDAILAEGKWPVLKYLHSGVNSFLPLTFYSNLFYVFGAVDVDRRYTVRLAKDSNQWETHTVNFFLDKDDIEVNPTEEATQTLTKLTLMGTTYELPSGSGESVDLTGYATESYVDTAIQDALNAIGVAEGGAY